MEALSAVEGWDKLLARLRLTAEADGAILELELAGIASTRGFEVGLGPATQPGRYADLQIVRHGLRRATSLYVEACALNPYSAAVREDLSFQDRLVPYLQLHLQDLEVGGRLLIDPTPEQEGELLAVAHAFWTRCLTSRRPDDLVIPGVLELWAVPMGEEESKRLFLQRGHHDGFIGGVASDDALKRTLRAVRSKIGQLPRVAAGLIVIEPPAVLWRDRALPQIIMAIQHELRHSSQVVGVALLHRARRPDHPVDRVRYVGPAVLLSMPDRLIFSKQALVVPNPGCGFREATSLSLAVF